MGKLYGSSDHKEESDELFAEFGGTYEVWPQKRILASKDLKRKQSTNLNYEALQREDTGDANRLGFGRDYG